jgi:hypothetical protein
MTEKVIRKSIDGGSANYWREQREGFVKVDRPHAAYVGAEQDGNIDAMDAAIIESAFHPGAVRILRAFGLEVRRSHWDSYPVILNKQELYAQSWDIPVFSKERK